MNGASFPPSDSGLAESFSETEAESERTGQVPFMNGGKKSAKQPAGLSKPANDRTVSIGENGTGMSDRMSGRSPYKEVQFQRLR